MHLGLNDIMNNKDVKCLKCNHMEFHATDFSSDYFCTKSEDIHNCDKFITKKQYHRNKKLKQILK